MNNHLLVCATLYNHTTLHKPDPQQKGINGRVGLLWGMSAFNWMCQHEEHYSQVFCGQPCFRVP